MFTIWTKAVEYKRGKSPLLPGIENNWIESPKFPTVFFIMGEIYTYLIIGMRLNKREVYEIAEYYYERKNFRKN